MKRSNQLPTHQQSTLPNGVSNCLRRLLHNRSVAATTGLHVVRVDARCRACGKPALPRLLAAVVVNVLEIKGVQMPRKVAEYRQADVDEQIYGLC